MEERIRTSQNADAALRLATRGWSVIPVHTVSAGQCSCGRPACPSPGKHPHVRWEEWTERAATPVELTSWWSRWPDANVGVVTGWVSAAVVLDVDPRSGGDDALGGLESHHGPLPDTVTCLTGGDGRHLWFAHPTDLVPSRPLAPGLDLKGEGGMVVVPPSRHASGHHYRWATGRAPGEHPLAEPPTWLVAMALVRDDAHRPGGRSTVERTETERQEFADLWTAVGLTIPPGESMQRCPFHDDHNPSLHVDADGCRWFCFGCRRGGGLQALGRLVHPGGGVSSRRHEVSPPTEPPTLRPEVPVDVVGESAHQDELLALVGGRRTWSGVRQDALARLVPEDRNEIDPLAVAVVIDDRVVGHLRRDDARAYRPLVERVLRSSGAATCLAQIRGGWERAGGDVGRLGVVVHLPRLTVVDR